jgi:tetratricopeptide (TPR) repeat protein
VKSGRRISGIGCALLLAGGIIPPATSQPAATSWPDVEGRIQYAYYTEDARALRSVLASLKPKVVEGEEEAAVADAVPRAYFLALVHYRLAQVLNASNKSQAKAAVDDCQDEVDHSVEALPKVPLGLDESDLNKHLRAEAYVLGTACTLAGREMSSMAFTGGRIGSRIEEALKLEPKNPRVRLVEALVAFDRAGKDAAARSAAIAKLRNVTTMFESARAGLTASPEWGMAEAYAFLGRALFEQRDVVNAREALERALLIAPDYAYAKRLAAQITR